jgi:hypothetical protein
LKGGVLIAKTSLNAENFIDAAPLRAAVTNLL